MKRGAGRLKSIGLGVLLAAVILEIGLRLLYGGGPPPDDFDIRGRMRSSRWISHPFLPYAGRPNGTWTLLNGPERKVEHIETNSYGFRTHEFPSEKHPEDFVIVCLGESSTFGFKVESNDKTWPARLETLLAETYPKRRIRAYNLGIDMATTAVSVVDMALIGVHLQPDLVIVYQAYNDLSALGFAEPRLDHSHFYRDLGESDIRARVQGHVPDWLLDHSYAILHVTGALDTLLTPNDLTHVARRPRQNGADRLSGLQTTLANLETLHSLATGRGAHILFSTFQFGDGRVDAALTMNEELRKFYAEKGYAYVDQDRLIPDGDPSINVDECHLSPKGEEMLTRNFYDAIVEQRLIPPEPGA